MAGGQGQNTILVISVSCYICTEVLTDPRGHTSFQTRTCLQTTKHSITYFLSWVTSLYKLKIDSKNDGILGEKRPISP